MNRDDFERLFDRLQPCLDEFAQGRFAATRRRRQAVAYYFHCFAMYPIARPDRSMVGTLAGLELRCEEALAGLPSEPEPLVVAVRRALETVHALAAAGMTTAAAHWENGEPSAALQVVRETLTAIYTWPHSVHLRATVYLETGEMLSDDTLHQERAQLRAALENCLPEGNP